MRLIGCTDVGCVRNENQDNYRAACLPDGTGWALVCDGMGGANGGKLAAGLACDAVEYLMASYAQTAPRELRAFGMQVLEQANLAVYRRACTENRYQGMGTTAVLVMVRGETAHICHVGDSRCYLFRGGKLTQLTRDHSYVQELVEKGAITPQEAETHPRKNVITRALGVEKTVEPEYTRASLRAGDILLLCSDGLSNAVQKARMEKTLAQVPFYEAAQVLVDTANACGGPDNITVLLAAPDLEVQHG